MEKKSSNASQFFLWLGAAIAISEILTGALIAPLGFKMGILSIFLGHAIGCVILYFTGLIGARSKLSSIESTRLSFGKYGSYVFSVLNVLQLIGWTAVMIINGAVAFNVVTQNSFSYDNITLWCVLIAALICVWVMLGVKNLSKITFISVSMLLLFSVALGVYVFTAQTGTGGVVEGAISFGAAMELSVIMPISWLPLISDYTRNVENEKMGTFSSAFGYFIGSTFMYTIGLGAAIFAGTSDISVILAAAGLPFVALVIIVFSTVTTTFLDVHSAAISFINIKEKANEKLISIIVCVVGLIIAVVVPLSQYEPFLYLIGSVFTPLFAIIITDYFILKNDVYVESKNWDLKNSIIWVVGVILYRMFMNIDTVLGTTLPVMFLIGIICYMANKMFKH